MGIAVDRYDRLAVGRPPDANQTGVIRAKRPEAVAAMRKAHASGVHVDDIAAAYGVCRRTVYRYLLPATTRTIEVMGWFAEFELRHSEFPVRVSPWRRGKT